MNSTALSADPRPALPARAWLTYPVAELAGMAEDELARADIGRLNLLCASGLPGSEGLDVDQCLRKLDAWTELVRRNTDHWWPDFLERPAEYDGSPARFRVMAMITVLQRVLGVRYNLSFSVGEYDARDSRDLFVHGVLSVHGGTCVTMPVVCCAIGRRLGYPLRLVSAKEHLFARWDAPDGERFNVECTSRGFLSEDDAYYRTWPSEITDEEVSAGIFLRSLSAREELAEFVRARGLCLLDNLQIGAAVETFACAARLAPENPCIRGSWAAATVIWRAFDAARRRNRHDGRRYLDLGNLPWPTPIEPWEHVAIPLARQDMERIGRSHCQRMAGGRAGVSAGST